MEVSDNHPAQKCQFQSRDGAFPCAHPVKAGTVFCVFHQGCDTNSDDVPPHNQEFESHFSRLVTSGSGNWKGFVFPRGIRLPNVIDFDVEALECQFFEFDQEKTHFRKAARFDFSLFRGGTNLRGVRFEGNSSFERCVFKGTTEMTHVEFRAGVSFQSAEFAQRTTLRIQCFKHASFGRATFRDALLISGWQNHNLQVQSAISASSSISGALVTGGKRGLGRYALDAWHSAVATCVSFGRSCLGYARRKLQATEHAARKMKRRYARADQSVQLFDVFGGEADFDGVIFAKPDQTVFTKANLSRVYLRGANLKSVRFLGVNWWQTRLRRNGLYDEVFITFTSDGPFRHRMMPELEEACRNVRASLEESRNYQAACDFYIAEMEAMRYQRGFTGRHIFSIPVFYRLLTFYGTSVGRGICVMAVLLLFHCAGTLWLNGALPVTSLGMEPFLDVALRTFRILILQSSDVRPTSNLQGWLDSICKVFSLIQIALIVFAFRARIRRN